jgi:geranylgeranyl diphosphate synthase type II
MGSGKRIRPILAIESCRACGGRIKDVIAIACAIEAVHSYSLAHDDLPAMDNADYRRGKPSCHKVFGEANAILAGDALLTLAFNIIAQNVAEKTAAAACRELSAAIGSQGMVGGQVMDLEFGRKRKTITILKNINGLKTSRLFEISAKLGAIAAGAGKRETAALARYGLSFGDLFQIADDVIDGDGFRLLMKRDEAIKEACISAYKAKKALKVFGSSARVLEEIAERMLKRIT